jgi:cytochrome c-type protein NapB
VKTKIMAIAVALGLALGLGMGSGAVSAEDLKGLRGQAVTAPDKAPEVYKVQDGVRHERAYRQQPPLVPHLTDKYEIDLKVNQCLRCHEWPYSDQEKAPKISDLHYIDRNGVRQDTVNGNRYVCTQCHVPQVDAKPLVENKFQPAASNR